MKERFARFMQGRYGADNFSRFLMVATLVFLVLSMFTGRIFWYIAIALLIYSYFRMFSRNISKRYTENQKYLQLKGKVVSFFKGQKNMAGQMKDYHIYKCPQCKQKIRIPRGKGKIEITCPKCKTTFIKRS